MKTTRDYLIGTISGILCLIAVSTHPVITRARPEILNPFFYAFCTVTFEALMVLPIMIVELKHFNKKMKQKKSIRYEKFNIKRKNELWKFLIIGGLFAFAQILFFIGFETADSVTGSIALKSAMVWTMIFGAIFLGEKITKLQIILTIIIFIALAYTISEGTFEIFNVNLGSVILFIVPLLWTIGHSITKPLLKKEIYIPSQVIFQRTLVSSILLGILYALTNPISDFLLIFQYENLIFILLISFAYLVGHYFWYNSIKYIEMAVSSGMQAVQPILTSLLATILLGENFSQYHLIGLIVITTSILGILYEKRKINILEKIEMEKEYK